MPRDIPVGNGNVLIAFDKDYLLREFYFPHVGEQNHVKEDPFRLGVWSEGIFSWLPEGWVINKDYLDDSLVTNVSLVNEQMGLKIICNDLVDYQENIYLKKFTVENLSHKERDVRIFMCHDFHISSSDIGGTAAFRPEVNGLLHYKGEYYFLVNIFANKKFGIDYFACGNKEQQSGYEGTWKDAEDGSLSQNPIAQGAVDSVAGIYLRLKPNTPEIFFYWISIGRNWNEVSELDKLLRKNTPELILKRTFDYWEAWVGKEELNYELIPEEIARLYKRSLLIARTQIDNNGSIIAGNDSNVVYFNRDTYSYMWLRDAALGAYAFDLSGYDEITDRFFNLCAQLIERQGYFMHKYTPAGMMASTWHPWQKDKKLQLPIQEDETALVIWALWKHYNIFRDIEFIKLLYKPLIKNAADFMMNYRDVLTGFPLPSYDLWEERQGILTYTVSTVYGGLTAAANFADLFGEKDIAGSYREGADKIRSAMDKYLYLKKENRFARMINFKSGDQIEIDSTVDASLYALFAFGAYPADDHRVKNTMEQVYQKLWCNLPSGGLARYENDIYHRKRPDITGNPWFITTLWLAQYYIATANNRLELDKAVDIMKWVTGHALPSGVLAEQLNPYTNEAVSVSPLTWSHTTFIMVVQEYMDRLLEIEKCAACGQPKYSKKIQQPKVL